jgi:hypothetical protein
MLCTNIDFAILKVNVVYKMACRAKNGYSGDLQSRRNWVMLL